MADRTPSYAGFQKSNGTKSGLTEIDRDKVTQENPPKSSGTRGYA